MRGPGRLLAVLLPGLMPMLAQANTVTIEAVRPDWGLLSLLPPLLAIGLALALRQVIPALFLGLWAGAWLVAGGGLDTLLPSLLATFDTWVVQALADEDHAAILLFSLMIGGMVGIITRNGGVLGVVDLLVRWARDTRRGMLATVGLGFAIFFDDYANTMVVGNTMRPVTDRLRISREKLAYLVDSTAAPVATLALVTTWIGYQVGLIGEAVGAIDGYAASGYAVFLASLGYFFYPILALVFLVAVAWTGRDFGPMLAAERAARAGRGSAAGQPLGRADLIAQVEIEALGGAPHRAVNAVLPVVLMVGVVIAGLFVTGEGDNLREVIGSANAYAALMWGSLVGVLAAALLSVGQRILSVDQVIDAWYHGMRSMMLALVILILAWALSSVGEALGTAQFLVSTLGDNLMPWMLPALVFVLAGLTAFSTGTSWGTMGILIPLVVPLAWAVAGASGDLAVFHASIAAVLSGAVWGDHCSPISDTTILSAMASGCDHIAHVRTQLPYAMLVGGVALVLCSLPVGFGLPWWFCLGLASLALVVLLRWLGQRA